MRDEGRLGSGVADVTEAPTARPAGFGSAVFVPGRLDEMLEKLMHAEIFRTYHV